ncbi:MAG: hypothetical protein IKA37_06840, partial [Spirochaetales bacterium]|nr:hypothetical protein [Spirochaetales bacterium]
MNRKQFLFLLLVFLFSILFSCDQQKDEFENLNLTAVWEKDLCAGSNSLNIDNRILYFNNNDHETRGIGGLNIETGETLWISEKIGYNSGNCVFDDSNVYAMNYVRKDKENEVYENLITIIDKENGEIKSQNKISG